MKILVIGGTGNFGRRIFQSLKNKNGNNQLVSLSRNPPKHKLNYVEYLIGDSNDEGLLNQLFEKYGFEIVIHIPNILLANVDALVSVCKKYHADQLIIVGSAAMFTKIDAPTKIIRQDKEEIIRDSGVNYTILRPNMVYGHKEDQNIYKLYKFINKYLLLIVPGSAEIKQSPTHIDDFVEALVFAISNPNVYKKSYNLVGPQPISLKEMAQILAKPKKIRVLEVPLGLSVFGLKVLRFLKVVNWHPEKLIRLNEEKVLETTSGALEELNYHPRIFEEGIKEYFN
ncbi:MAG: NAD-dependent epimerase/dehydratase family protein [Algoriphagus sp.]|uniref:SDR family oxidoreductase n=1 Tax=Algoriphagus sp. TaxID=1872435 RepID=UPI0026221F68|nr:NAD-dependent epimerase/dehydratase family protein [Algoriphagus sp.]MDG1275696.1 NAD-dependent epimerase/dehydratase family protein [Algoriphagus sp.]